MRRMPQAVDGPAPTRAEQGAGHSQDQVEAVRAHAPSVSQVILICRCGSVRNADSGRRSFAAGRPAGVRLRRSGADADEQVGQARRTVQCHFWDDLWLFPSAGGCARRPAEPHRRRGCRAARRVTLRQGTKDAILDAQRAPDGRLYDPNTGLEIPEGGGHFGRRPGFECFRTQQMAREQR